MAIEVTRKDVAWNYVAKFLRIGSGFITFPVTLHYLTPDEIGANTIMLTVSSIVALLDFGFGPQFSRNFTYVNSGAQSLKKNGISCDLTGEINYHLLSVLLKTARYVYQRLSLICLLVMLSFGSIYMYDVTNHFSNIPNVLLIWLLFCFSTYFEIYFSYYNSLLIGSGMVTEAAKSTILSRGFYVIICVSLLYFDYGLFAVVFATFLSPFIQRFYSYQVYYTRELRNKLEAQIDKEEIKETFVVIWYNAKKLGITFVGGYAITKAGIFLAGLFLPLSDLGSYGVLTQLVSLLHGIAMTLFTSYQPGFSYYRVTKQVQQFKELVSFTTFFYISVMIIGGLFIVFIIPFFLDLIGSKTKLPPIALCLTYIIVMLLEGNHSMFSTIITTNNEVPFVPASLISGCLIVLSTFITLKFTNLGLWGVVLSQGVVQLAYNNWKWPLWVFRDSKLSISEYFDLAIGKMISSIRRK